MPKFNLTFQLSNSHIDKNNKLNLKSLVDFIQDTEGLHIYSLGKLTSFLNNLGGGIFLKYRQIDLYDSVGFSSNIKVITYPYETNSFYGYRNTLIEHEGKVIASSYSIGPFVNIKTSRPIKITEDIINSMKHYNKYEMDYTSRKIELLDEKYFIKQNEVLITNQHIDRYNHVNNSFYIMFAENILNNNNYNRIRTDYLKPLIEGEIIKIKLYQKNDISLIQIINSNDELSTIVEFSKR